MAGKNPQPYPTKPMTSFQNFEDYDYLEWSKDFKLCFSGFRYTYFDIFNKMVVQHLVGNSEN